MSKFLLKLDSSSDGPFVFFLIGVEIRTVKAEEDDPLGTGWSLIPVNVRFLYSMNVKVRYVSEAQCLHKSQREDHMLDVS